MTKKESQKKRKPRAGKESKAAALPEKPWAWEPRQTWTVLGLILSASFVLGVIAVIQFKESPFFNLPIIDEQSYVKWASEISGGEFLGDKIFYQDPLYPYFLALVFWFAGESYLLVRLLQVVMGTASIGLVFWTGKKLMGEGPALFAAGIMAAYRGLYFFELLILKATTVIFLSALSCALGVAAADRPYSKWRWLSLGVSLGLLTLLRGNFQAIIPFLLVWAFVFARHDPVLSRLYRAGLFALGLGLVLIPISIRNYAVAGELVLTTSQGGANFYIGNNERANGRYVTLPFVRANPEWEALDFEAEAEKRTGRDLSPSQVSRYWFSEALSWIKAHPKKALRLLLFKARLMVHNHEIPDNHSFYLTRDLFVPVLWLPFLGFGLLWGPALVGAWVKLRQDRRFSYPALFAILYSLSIIPFFIVARYRLAVVPGLAVFTAAALVWAEKKWKERDFRALGPATAAVAASLLIGLLPTAVSRAPLGIEYYLLGNAYLKTGQPGEAIPFYDKALSVLPDHEEATRNRSEAMFRVHSRDVKWIMAEAGQEEKSAKELVELGKRLERLGQVKLAAQVYERAAKKAPDLFAPRARLGFLYSTNPQVKDRAKALVHLEAALSIRPGDLDTMNAMGNCYFLFGDTARARGWWEKVLKRNPDNQGARSKLEVLKSRSE